jgi:hypothetical protein
VIRALRVRHRAAALAMAVGLPVLVVAALAARVPGPVVGSANPVVVPAGPVVAEIHGQRADGSRLLVRVHGAGTLPERAVAVSVPVGALGGLGEVLAYWAAEGDARDVDRGALLGALRADVPVVLPAGVDGTSGVLVLYDLAHAEVVATVALEGAGGAGRTTP